MVMAPRGIRAGKRMADAMIEWLHFMYNKNTAKRVLNAVIAQLQKRAKEFEP